MPIQSKERVSVLFMLKPGLTANISLLQMPVRAPSLEKVTSVLSGSTVCQCGTQNAIQSDIPSGSIFVLGDDVDPSFQYDPQKGWRENLYSFDRSKIMYQLQKYPLKRELIDKATEIRKGEDRNAAVAALVNGWPVVLWGGSLRMDVLVGRIDESRELRFIQDIGGIAGGTIIDMEGLSKGILSGVKFNYDFTHLFDVGMYTYLEQLLHIAAECNAGVHTKLVGFAGSKTKPELNYRLLLSRGMHIYPGFGKGVSIEEEKRRLTKFWEMGKELWGNAFYVYDFTIRDRPGIGEIYQHVMSLEGVSGFPFNGYNR